MSVYKLFIVWVCGMCILGCASSKKVVYLQDIKVDKRIKAACEYRTVIHVDDLLSIIVSCDDIEAALPFNTPMIGLGKEVTSGNQQAALGYLVDKEGLADRFYINSAATSREEIGNGVHHGTVAKLKKKGIPVIPHRAVQMTLNDYEEYDYLIGMDTENIRNMQRISGGDPDEKIYKLLTFAGSGLDVADPWYTGDFEATYRDVLAGCKGLLECLKEEL